MSILRIYLLFFLSFVSILHAGAQIVSGYVKDSTGKVLPFSSILVKGTTKGVSANASGYYQINLEPGDYVLIAQYIGYSSEQKKITVRKESTHIDFVLQPQQYQLVQVEVSTKGEDPA